MKTFCDVQQASENTGCGEINNNIQIQLLVGDTMRCFILLLQPLTLNAGFAPCSSKVFTAPAHKLYAAICRAVPKLKSLQVASTSTIKYKRYINSNFKFSSHNLQDDGGGLRRGFQHFGDLAPQMQYFTGGQISIIITCLKQPNEYPPTSV